jgi:hypothetical protein
MASGGNITRLNYVKYMTNNVEIIVGKTSAKGIEDFREYLKGFASEHEISNISTTLIQPYTISERIVATTLYD